MKTGIITKAKGSAYIEQGQTKAICAVYGPREIPRRSDFSMRGILNCTLEHTPYAKERRKAPGSQKDDLEAEMSNAIGQALEATVCMVSFFVKIVLRMQLNLKCKIVLFWNRFYISQKEDRLWCIFLKFVCSEKATKILRNLHLFCL